MTEEKFWEELAAMANDPDNPKKKWMFVGQGKLIRLIGGIMQQCPVTAVVNKNKNGFWYASQFPAAAREINLDKEFATEIASAADGARMYNLRLRERLIKVLGL